MFRSRNSAVFVIAIVLCSAVGFVLTHAVFADMRNSAQKQVNKLEDISRLVDRHYVEDINWDEAMEGAINGMLEKLDPHSVYIPAEKVKGNKENFAGKYEGIGIQFDVLDGYITVISPIPGSPAYRLGIIAGDRIVKINGESAIGISSDDVPKKLKGPKGTSVDVMIQRTGVAEELPFTIVRDEVPISTITASFMVDDSTGYIAVNRFAMITAKEVEERLVELEKQNMKRLVLDLRWNSGGYLYEAVKMAGKFISGHKKIVYTKGREGQYSDGAEDYFADQFGRKTPRDCDLVVLINRGSASAAEIVAGAIQDYDRGMIVGENSFGKGLVQKEFMLNDGSAVRITTAKYYTPSGRCIQRDYKGKEVEEYYEEISDSAWAATQDSITDRPLFYTAKGRQVYGGGGIQPDIQIRNAHKSQAPKLVNEILKHRLFFEFANDYATRHPELKSSLASFRKTFRVNRDIMNAFKKLCLRKGVKLENGLFEKDERYLQSRIKGEIARKFWENDGYYYIMLDYDTQFLRALDSFEQARELAQVAP